MQNLQTGLLTDFTESDFVPQHDIEAGDWFEDASSSADWTETDTFSTIGDVKQPPDVLNELYEQNKMLESKCHETEQKYDNALFEIKKQTLKSVNETQRANKYHQKLQYIYSQLKSFKELKPNDTWSGLDLTLEDVSFPLESITEQNKSELFQIGEVVGVKRSDIELMKETLAQLKLMVDYKASERSREDNANGTTHPLRSVISILNDTISKQHNEITSLRKLVNDQRKHELINKENYELKKIIMKLETKHRQTDNPHHSPILTDKETNLVEAIFKSNCPNIIKTTSLRQPLTDPHTTTRENQTPDTIKQKKSFHQIIDLKCNENV
ncbi:hypothetical protein FQA39_LY03734 [Lamprigera yunnana]|nr:hypothetical protein FQA39_LY03734 [Lamprigera yunnana]